MCMKVLLEIMPHSLATVDFVDLPWDDTQAPYLLNVVLNQVHVDLCLQKLCKMSGLCMYMLSFDL